MASEPWFKFYAADFLVDAAVDSLPLEAQAILLRMWCLCHIDGSCPAEPKEIARKTRLSVESVVEHLEELSRFFDLRDGRLYSRRMEVEKAKSETARRNGQKRGEQIRSANRSADGSADCSAQSQSQSQDQNLTPSPSSKEVFDFSLQKKKGKTEFSQVDYDDRDRRELGKAIRELGSRLRASAGCGDRITDERFFEWACEMAGISVQRGLEVQKSGRRWPEEQEEAFA